MGDGTKSSRREFAKTLAVMAATPLLARVGKAQGSLAIQGQAGDQPVPEGEALAQMVRIRYGKHLSEAQMAEVRKAIDGRLRGADRMRQVKFANGDEPAFIFSAGID